MENLSELKQLHSRVQNDIFRIMIDYKVLCHLGSTLPGKVSLYGFADEYTFLISEVPLEVATFINSVNRLIETGYLSIVSTPANAGIFFIKTAEYDQLTEVEKHHFTLISGKTFTDLLNKKRKLQLLG